MALQTFTDSAGRQAWRDTAGNVYTEGGKNKTGYNVQGWNQRQQNRYAQPQQSSSSQSSQSYSIQPPKYVTPDPQKYQQMFQQASAPVIGQLQQQKGGLQQQYNDIINQIKGQQTVAEQGQTRVTSGELGKRGLSADSTLAQQEIQNALLPVSSQYTGLIGQAGRDRGAQEAQLAQQIAGIQSGDITNAIDYAQRMAGLQNTQAQQQYSNQLGMQQYQDTLKQQQIENALKQQQEARLGRESGGPTAMDLYERYKRDQQQQTSFDPNLLGWQGLPRGIAGPPQPIYRNQQPQTPRLPMSFNYDTL